MDEKDITNAVQQEYARKMAKWTNVTVVSIEPSTSSGYLAVVEALDDDGEDVEEICYVDPRGKVRIFDTSGELVRYLSSARSWETRLFSPSTVGAAAFLLTLIAVIALTFLKVQNDPGLDALKGLLALAAGFYFGNQASKS